MPHPPSVPRGFSLANPVYEAARKALIKAYGRSNFNCGAFTHSMAHQFPELTRVPGFYFDSEGGRAYGEHWWLEDAAGNVIDPTADQFPARENGFYVRYDPELHLIAKGKCMNCGEPLYTRESAYPCSAECDESMAEEYECAPAGGPYEVDMEFKTDAEIMRKYGIRFNFLVAREKARKPGLSFS